MVFQAKNGVDVEKTVTDTQFKIATNSKLFSILSDSIYTRKIDAVIRELCCNAFDAQVEARQARPFQVILPDAFTPEFRVRDFGSGLCDADMQMYTTYGESTKSGSNAYIGAFGIGAKSPFAYTNTFNVTSYHGGFARSYSMFVEDGIPKMTLLGEAESDEPSGLEVFFAVAEKDIDEFKDKAIEICALMHDKIEFLNVPDVWREQLRLEIAKYQWEAAPYLGDGYMTSGLEVDTRCRQDLLRIVQGNVVYAMDRYEVLTMLKLSLDIEYNKVYNQMKDNFYIAGTLKVPNGTFIPHPSRERLTFDELTKETIKVIFEKIYKYFIVDAVDRILTDVRSYFDLHTRLKKYSKLVTNNHRIMGYQNQVQNQNCVVNSSGLCHFTDYDSWLRTSFFAVYVHGAKDKDYRFKSIPTMTMTGELIDRFYYSSKYPLSEDYRYRIIFDKQQTESEKAIIITSNAGLLFTEDDLSTFVNVQSLPKLTPQELAQLKKKKGVAQLDGRARVTQEEVSFLAFSDGKSKRSAEHIWLSQRTCKDIEKYAVDYPVYWVSSNRRYEMKLAETTYHLKLKSDLWSLYRRLEFFLNSHKDTQPNYEKNGLYMGVMVLPDGHCFKDVFPNLIDSLQNAMRKIVADYEKTNFYVVDKRADEALLGAITNEPDLLTSLVGSKKEYKEFFESWIAEGKPDFVERIFKWDLPFNLSTDGGDLKSKYSLTKNVHKFDVSEFYRYLSENGYSLLSKYTYYGCYEKELVSDLIFYLKEKNKHLVQKGKDGN